MKVVTCMICLHVKFEYPYCSEIQKVKTKLTCDNPNSIRYKKEFSYPYPERCYAFKSFIAYFDAKPKGRQLMVI